MASAYSSAQLAAYETHISLPARFLRSASPPLDIAYLSALHARQLAKVPYENLLLHYTPAQPPVVSLNPQDLYKKIVTDARGRGGYCMEANIFFNHVLKGLGFDVYMTGVRMRSRVGGVPQGDYGGWVHIVNIVTLPNGSKCVTDVGFGGDGSTHPLPLTPDIPTLNLGTQEVRLIHSSLPSSSPNTPKHWIYQYRNSPSKPWNAHYCFTESEWFAPDFEVVNWFTSTSLGIPGMKNIQLAMVLVVKFLLAEDGSGGIGGKVMLIDGEVKRNLGGRTEVVKVCESEGERVKALREYFGILLTEEEVKGIAGRLTELHQGV